MCCVRDLLPRGFDISHEAERETEREDLIPPARDTSVTTRLGLTTSLPRPNLRTKKFTHKLWPTPLPTDTVTHNPLYISLPAYIRPICTLFVSFAVFIYYFNCISFAIRLSGSKVAIKLIDWTQVSVSCRRQQYMWLRKPHYDY